MSPDLSSARPSEQLTAATLQNLRETFGTPTTIGAEPPHAWGSTAGAWIP